MSVVQTVEAEVDQPIVPVPPVGRQAKPEQSPAKYVNPNEMITVPKGAISMQSKLRHRLANSTIARGAAFPLRTMIVARYDAHVVGRSVDWLVHGRETTNFTYDLDPLNRDHSPGLFPLSREPRSGRYGPGCRNLRTMLSSSTI